MSSSRKPGRPAIGGPQPVRQGRIAAALWVPFVNLTDNKPWVAIRQFIAWFNREPGAKLPERPPAPESRWR